MDFNFHPAAFKITGPSMADIRGDSDSMIPTSLRSFIVMGLIASWMWFLCTQTNMLEQLNMIKIGMMNIGMQGIRVAIDNWIHIALSLSSGAIGFGTAAAT